MKIVVTKQELIEKLIDTRGLKNGWVIIMRGLPGSGKSTLAKKLAETIGLSTICSSDNFFIDSNGTYLFNKNFLPNAHRLCLRHFLRYLTNKYTPFVIVDNTNLNRLEWDVYAKIAHALDYGVIFITMQANVEKSFNNNTHSVPLATIQKMEVKFNKGSIQLDSLNSNYICFEVNRFSS
jgi:predicted kinase